MRKTPTGVRRDNALRAHVTCFIGLIGIVLSGCGSSSASRDYTKVVRVEGRNVLKITCEYVGKRPGEPSSYVNNHDFRRIDTDFYRLTFENLTDSDVFIEGVAYRMETGSTKGLQFASADSIRNTWGTNIVPQKSSISRANNMVWSKSRRNALIKTYSFRIPTRDGSHEIVESEISLVYKR